MSIVESPFKFDTSSGGVTVVFTKVGRIRFEGWEGSWVHLRTDRKECG